MALYILEVLSLHQDANMRGWICVIEMECARHSVGSGSPTLRFVPGLKGCPTSKESGATPDASKAATNCNFRYLHRDSRSAVPKLPDLFTDPEVGMLDLEIITCDEMQVQ